jgi:hypothetical protein
MDTSIIIHAVGDINLGINFETSLVYEKELFPFQKVYKQFENADIVFGNLECPLTNNKNLKIKKNGAPSYKAPTVYAERLKKAGFEVINIANNHIFDSDSKGFFDTLDVLSERKIKSIGAGKNLSDSRKPAFFKIKSKRIAFLGYTYANRATNTKEGCAPIEDNIIKQDVELLKSSADIIIVSLHEGVEYSDYPNPYARKLCRTLIDAGANIILRHHSHCIQGIEKYKNGLIAYSLGNFVFDQHQKDNWEKIKNGTLISTSNKEFFNKQLDIQKPRESIILKIRISDNNEIDYEAIPIYINDDFIPEIAIHPIKETILSRLSNLNEALVKKDDPVWKISDSFYKKYQRKKILKTFVSNIFKIHKIKRSHINYLKRIYK